MTLGPDFAVAIQLFDEENFLLVFMIRSNIKLMNRQLLDVEKLMDFELS